MNATPRGGVQPALMNHTAQLLERLLTDEFAADQVTSRYFREHAKLGHNDRGLIAEAVFAVLRHRLEFAHFAQSGSGPLTRRMALLGIAYACGMDATIARVGPAEAQWLTHIASIDRLSLPFDVRCNLPPWLLERLGTRFAPAELETLANSLNRPAPLDLRANLLKTNRESALAALKAAGVSAEPCRYAPSGIRLRDKPALQNLMLFKNGDIEVQDEGSQLLAWLVAPRRGELVIDFCAGAGGKTLALGALMRSTGRLYAMDVSSKRLDKLKPRLARSGLTNVHPVVLSSENDPKLKRMAAKADRVLVDAPCSGLGTLRRNPDLKWRQSPDTVNELCAKQALILAAAARLVKPGGRLVYATCSMLEEENSGIVNAFLRSNSDFLLIDARESLRVHKIELDTGPCLELWPHVHGTDGFFAAVMQRRSGSESASMV